MSRYERALVGRGLREGGYVSRAFRHRNRKLVAGDKDVEAEIRDWKGTTRVAGFGDAITIGDVKVRMEEQERKYRSYLEDGAVPPGWERFAQSRGLPPPPRIKPLTNP